MDAKKKYNPNGSTRLIIVHHDNKSYSAYTPKQAVQMINLLKSKLWQGK